MPGCPLDSRLSSRHQAGYLVALATHPARLAHPGAAFAGAAAWLPGQLPLALLIAAGEASIALWLGWWRGWRRAWGGVAAGQRFRPGLVALARRRVVAAALSAGHTVTADGCGLGLQISTGRFSRLQLGRGGERRARHRHQSGGPGAAWPGGDMCGPQASQDCAAGGSDWRRAGRAGDCAGQIAWCRGWRDLLGRGRRTGVTSGPQPGQRHSRPGIAGLAGRGLRVALSAAGESS